MVPFLRKRGVLVAAGLAGLLVVAGIAAILTRPPRPRSEPSVPRGSTGDRDSILHGDRAHSTLSEAGREPPVPGIRPGPGPPSGRPVANAPPQQPGSTGSEAGIEVLRYPVLDAPTSVAPGLEFAAQVWLSESDFPLRPRIDAGDTTASGGLRLRLPPSPGETWPLDVVLTAPGFRFSRGANSTQIQLHREGDSSPAVFFLSAEAGVEGDREIYASIWHEGTFLTRFHRVVRVEKSTTAPALAAGSDSSPAMEPATNRASQPTRARAVFVDSETRVPDLTVLILRGLDPSDTSAVSVIVDSPHLQVAAETVRQPLDTVPWIRTCVEGAVRGRLLEQPGARPDSAGALARLRGFGRELYRRCAPRVFKDAFWRLRDRLGPRFASIQIYTNDPRIPWELMRPYRQGAKACDFLCLEYSVARWHVGSGIEAMERPPEELPVAETVLIAPDYGAERRLPSQGTEMAALGSLPGFRRAQAESTSLNEMLHLPRGILHFAGHGLVKTSPGRTPEFVLDLAGGEIDPVTWRGMVTRERAGHPLVFFNACELGQAGPVCGFVDGWAPALLESGAGGFIGGLWPLEDRSASLFAAAFYARIREGLDEGGVDVSEALRASRKEMMEKGNPVSLAYVLYGSPFLELVPARR